MKGNQMIQNSDKALDTNLKQRPAVAFSAFSFLFSEIVQHMMQQEKEA